MTPQWLAPTPKPQPHKTNALGMTREDLIAFEEEVAEAFKQKRCKGPVHLSGGNEVQLLSIFRSIHRQDWVLSTYRNHYHALLHGVPRDWLMAEILAGRSMNISSPKHRFLTSAIVGGMLPIATGLAYALKADGSPRKVWCFIGDMAARSGAFHEAYNYAVGHQLPVRFVIENNGVSCDTPTAKVWGTSKIRGYRDRSYLYNRRWPHSGVGAYVF